MTGLLEDLREERVILDKVQCRAFSGVPMVKFDKGTLIGWEHSIIYTWFQAWQRVNYTPAQGWLFMPGIEFIVEQDCLGLNHVPVGHIRAAIDRLCDNYRSKDFIVVRVKSYVIQDKCMIEVVFVKQHLRTTGTLSAFTLHHLLHK